MRATTGGSPARSVRSASTESVQSTAITQVEMDCSGVAPPPITDSPGITSVRRAGRSGASSTIQSLVNAYNTVWQTIQTDTTYNAQTNSSARFLRAKFFISSKNCHTRNGSRPRSRSCV